MSNNKASQKKKRTQPPKEKIEEKGKNGSGSTATTGGTAAGIGGVAIHGDVYGNVTITPPPKEEPTPSRPIPALPSGPRTNTKFLKFLIVTGIIVISVVVLLLLAPPHGSATPSIFPTSNSTVDNSPTGIIQPTQPQVINLTSTPSGAKYTIRFVARPIPADGELHKVYFSVDNGTEQVLFTAGDKVDHTFYPTFSRSIRVRVAINPGTVLHEELYVNGNLITSSESADNNGLTYQIP